MSISMTEEHREREETVLAGMMRWAPNVQMALDIVKADDFTSEVNQHTFRAIVAVWDKGRDAENAIDAVLVLGELEQAGVIERFALAGGLSKGAKLDTIGFLATVLERDASGAWCEQYCRKVLDYSLKRKLRGIGAWILNEVESPSCATEEIVSQLQQEALNLETNRNYGKFVHISEAVREAMNEMDRRKKGCGALSGIATGYKDLDNFTDGFQRGELILVAARPSVGKTALGANLCRNAAESGHSTAFFSIEQATKELAYRFLAAESGVSSLRMRKGFLDQAAVGEIMEAGRRLNPLPISFNDSGKQTVQSIASLTRKMKIKYDLQAIYVDYIQIMKCENRNLQLREQVSEFSGGLKRIARELNIAVIAMAQLNRKADEKETPRLSDLKESGKLEEDADVVILLHRKERREEDDLIDAILAKNRNGPCGVINLCYKKAAMKFYEVIPGIPT